MHVMNTNLKYNYIYLVPQVNYDNKYYIHHIHIFKYNDLLNFDGTKIKKIKKILHQSFEDI